MIAPEPPSQAHLCPAAARSTTRAYPAAPGRAQGGSSCCTSPHLSQIANFRLCVHVLSLCMCSPYPHPPPPSLSLSRVPMSACECVHVHVRVRMQQVRVKCVWVSFARPPHTRLFAPCASSTNGAHAVWLPRLTRTHGFVRVSSAVADRDFTV
jgi:hypothetical protein